MESGAAVPRAYLLWSGADPNLVLNALVALSITPLCCVIITNVSDSPLAYQFGQMVVRTENEKDAIAFSFEAFEKTQMPSLVIVNDMSGTPGIVALYEDMHAEDLNCPALDLTIN